MALKQKKWIVTLLAASCLAALFHLFGNSENSFKNLASTAQADSLITEVLYDFDIADSQIRKRTVSTDSLFSRTIYTVKLPPDISKTELHYQLQKKIIPYKMDSPAKIIMPEKDMHIHLLYEGTVIRTVQLRTDTEPKTISTSDDG
jgi:hypothetical protein